jgi:hypothetical protein
MILLFLCNPPPMLLDISSINTFPWQQIHMQEYCWRTVSPGETEFSTLKQVTK